MQAKQFEIKKWAQNNAIYLVLVAIIVLITVKNPAFLEAVKNSVSMGKNLF